LQQPVPRRHWRSYGNDPLPTGEQAMDEPLRVFPSWFLRIVCDRCGKRIGRVVGSSLSSDTRPTNSRTLLSQKISNMFG
jgi:hypothetical protein